MLFRREAIPEENVSFHYDDPKCARMMRDAVYNRLIYTDPHGLRDIVYLCIGTDRATGDCLGPLVGSIVKGLLPAAVVFGTLEQPAHAMNLSCMMQEVSSHFSDPLIIAIDACLGRVERIGFINVKHGSLKPGTALQKDLPEVGDFHVSGVVNVGGLMDHLVLQNTRLGIVYRMAEVIARGIVSAYGQFTLRNQHY